LSTLLKLADLVTVVNDRAQEMALATKTTAEIARYLNLAAQDLRNRHDWVETRTSTNLSFTKSSTYGYATVTAPTDWWAPSYLNNADNDYKFWWTEPDVIYELDRGDKYTYDDVEQAFAKDGANLVIYHDTTETLTLKYYSKYLVATASTGVAKETFNADGATADWFIPTNDNILITRTLMFLAQKEPDSINEYNLLKMEFEQSLADEKRLNPSQRPDKLEPINIIG